MKDDVLPFYRALGRKIERLRRERGLSQDAVARQLCPSVTRANISNIEKGKQRAVAHVLFQLADILDVDVSHLFPDVRPQVGDQSAESFESELAAKVGKAESRELIAKLNVLVGGRDE